MNIFQNVEINSTTTERNLELFEGGVQDSYLEDRLDEM